MKQHVEYLYSIVDREDHTFVYEDRITVRDDSRDAKKHWKETGVDCVILQTKLTTEYKIVR